MQKSDKTIKRLVVKLGSSQIVDGKLKPRLPDLKKLIAQVAVLRKKNIDVVIVSSGAIALGMGELNEHKRPTDLGALQARAAIGQAVLMRLYAELLKKYKLKCAQVLLTRDDLDNHTRSLNAKHTLDAILSKGIIPIINENDTTATEEIKFGDNDRLSALVAELIHAQMYIILSDVKGFHDRLKKVIAEIPDITPDIISMASGTLNEQVAKGGMITKLEAFKITTKVGIRSIIAAGNEPNILIRLYKGELVGTYFHEKKL